MSWTVSYLPEVEKDLRKLDGSERLLIAKAVRKVSKNPLPANEGGYGKPLGHKNANDLTGLLKIKLRKAGLRVVYRLIRNDSEMNIVVVGVRADAEVYEIAARRLKKRR